MAEFLCLQVWLRSCWKLPSQFCIIQLCFTVLSALKMFTYNVKNRKVFVKKLHAIYVITKLNQLTNSQLHANMVN